MLRDLKPYEPTLHPRPAGLALATSPLFDPQRYAIRRPGRNRIDTLDNIQGAAVRSASALADQARDPGYEHVVDWMVLDTSFTYSPPRSRQLRQTILVPEYQYVLEIGDARRWNRLGGSTRNRTGRAWARSGCSSPPGPDVFLHRLSTDRPADSRMVTDR